MTKHRYLLGVIRNENIKPECSPELCVVRSFEWLLIDRMSKQDNTTSIPGPSVCYNN